jgi:hypothetical protein
MEPRLPPHLEVAALIRRTESAGGFAAVLKKGHPEAGTILLVLSAKGADLRAFERMPQADGTRAWHCARRQGSEKPEEFSSYLARRGEQDGDLWIVELDIAQGERLIGLDG